MKFIKKSSLRAVAAFATLVFIASFSFTSCNNDVDDVIPPIEDMVATTLDTTLESKSISTRALSDFSQRAYSIHLRYKNNWYHINQYDKQETSSSSTFSDRRDGWPNGTSNPGNCSWSNYTMAVGCVGKASLTIGWNDYRLDKARRLKDFMKNSRGNYVSGSILEYIYRDYGLVYDNPSRVGVYWDVMPKTNSVDNHNNIANAILTHLAIHETPIVIIGVKSGYGHYYTIVAVEWYGSVENSILWVADSTLGTTDMNFEQAKSANAISGVNFKTFLKNMSNGPASAYSRCNLLYTYDLRYY